MMGLWLAVLGCVMVALSVASATGWAADGSSCLPGECAARGGLPNFFEKLNRGEDVHIAYLGGSITKAPGWQTMTVQWFQEQYPEAQVEGINAGISGTGSDLGVFRLEHDCLRYEPDLLFVEFAANDGGTSTERIYKSMEGIVRQAWRAQPDLDICFVYVVWQGMTEGLRQGEVPHTYMAHEAIADHYDIPTIHMGLEVARLEKEGKLILTGKWPETEEEQAALGDRILFSVDGAHPYDAGHQLYAEAVARSMEEMKGVGVRGPHALPAPFRKDNFESAKPTVLERAELSSGWRKLDLANDPGMREFRQKMEFGDKLDALWLAEEPGESISFRFKGTSVMMYDVMGPDCGQVIVTVDDQEPKVIPRFDSWCEFHRVTVLVAATDVPDTVHTIKFEIDDEQPDKAKMLAERGVAMDDPRRYDGTKWYVGYMLVTGQVVE
jgi:lysophospholipase L1-like esterase